MRGAVALLQLFVLVAVDPTGVLALLAEVGVVGNVLSALWERERQGSRAAGQQGSRVAG